MVQWRYAGGGDWADAVQGESGVSADMWWWTEIPLDVSGKEADLRQADRQVELEFRTIGWDEQAGSVLSHTVEWQLTEVGESHQQLNPETDELESVDAHLIQMGEKMILHVPYPEDVPAGCATKVWVEEDTSVQSVYTSETVEDASSGLPNGVFTFANESPNYVVKGEVASTETMLQEGQQTGAEWEQDPNYGLIGSQIDDGQVRLGADALARDNHSTAGEIGCYTDGRHRRSFLFQKSLQDTWIQDTDADVSCHAAA